jgi:formylglycine-generating enzyme required for sulfatase activity
MINRPIHLDASSHPLARGHAPYWASEWGEDRYGVFVAFSLGEVTQRLRWIPAGRFRMGSPEDEPGRYEHEGPQHEVSITRGFWLFDTPCTQALWEAVMGDNPSRFTSPNRPVEAVSWYDVQSFLTRIEERLPGLGLSLPTEAQWEYACRAGTDTPVYTGSIDILGANNAPGLDPIAWYGGNSGEGYELDEGFDSSGWEEMQYPNVKSGTRVVARKAPNAWGLYDMLGNVWEWCADGLRTYDQRSRQDPVWPSAARSPRVRRGGSWRSDAPVCRSAVRDAHDPAYLYSNLGFRGARIQA